MLLSAMISLQLIHPGAADFADLGFSRAPPADAATLPEAAEEAASEPVHPGVPGLLPVADVVREACGINGTK